tara:strand:+ start:17068 stop:18201 length:1134 start_codon:yes stop_codon:yes gene_type:complete
MFPLAAPVHTTTEQDRRHMAAALALSRRHLGRTWPNPSVGCVIVRDGYVVGRGVTAPGGRPHAETEALKQAGVAAKGGTAYVTLEPCAHQGETAPCCDALVDAGVSRVVIALGDPDPRTAGAGIARLDAAGISVTIGVGEEEARELHAGFLCRITLGRPLVTLKVAASLDGNVATASGDSQWITGALAREQGHLLRAENDGIIVGGGTARQDDPSLTCRLPGLRASTPVRIVCDSDLSLSLQSKLVESAGDHPTWLFGAEDADGERRMALEDRGVDIVEVPRTSDGGLDPYAVFACLGERGMTRLLVEGGPTWGSALLRAGLVDRLAWFFASVALGGDAKAAVGELDLQRLADAATWRVLSRSVLGDDTLVMLARQG